MNATRKLPEKTANVMLAVWIEAVPAVEESKTGAGVVGGFGSSLQHADCVPFVLPGQQNWPRPRS